MKPYTVSDDAPVAVLLATYRYLWTANPLWLVNTPGVTDPREDKWQAVADAVRIVEQYRASSPLMGMPKIAA